MTKVDAETHFPALEAAGHPEMIAATLAAVEYSLASSMIVRDRSDIESAKHWSDLLEPFEHQVRNLITFCRLGPVQLIADDVGLGKTISAGLIISELLVRKRIKRVLVLAPKILLPQWKDELWAKFRIRAGYGVGKELSKLLARRSENVVVTTYPSARDRMDEIVDGDFDMLVLDEAHKVRNLYGTRNPPKVAKEIQRITADGVFRFLLLLSATPVQNRLWDLYSLIDILAGARNHPNPLGLPPEFASTYLANRATARSIKPEAMGRFRRVIGEYLVRTTRKEADLPFPERVVRTQFCKPTNVEPRLEAIVRTHLPRLRPLQQVGLAEALMSSPAAFAEQATNPANLTQLDVDAREEVRAIAAQSPLGCKADQLFELVDELNEQDPESWRLLIFTRRVATQRELGLALAAKGARVGYIGGGFTSQQDTFIQRFQADRPSINVLISTDSGAEGVNLQACNVVVNYDLPWNPMVLEQRIGRVQRLGSKHPQVVVVNLVVKNSVEEVVVARLMERLQLIAHAMGDVEGILGILDDDEDLERQIQDLVLLALAGGDIEAGRKRIEESIARAKELYKDSMSLVQESLGKHSLDALHLAVPSAPEIEPVAPRLSVRELVRVHFENRGDVTELDDGRLRIRELGAGTHYVTFDEWDPHLKVPVSKFGTAPTRLYAAGERAFDQLVGAASTKRLHNVRTQDVPEADLKPIAQAWISRLSPSLVWEGARVRSVQRRFVGGLTALVTTVNAFDRLQRLVEVQSPEGGWLDAATQESNSAGLGSGDHRRLFRGSLPAAAIDALESAAKDNESISSFSKYYEARLTDELGRTRELGSSRQRTIERFKPTTTAELIAAEGTLDSLKAVEVGYRYEDGVRATATIVVNGAGIIVNEPQLVRCELTGGSFPASDLGECAVTGKRALKHLMLVSSVSGAHMLPHVAIKCAVSGDILLPDEVVTSEFSSRPIAPGRSVRCAVTGKYAGPDEVATCAFTGAMAHTSCMATSEVSGQLYRIDQQAASVISGTTGHVSEFVTCELTGTTVHPSEVATSAASGRRIRRDLLVPSGKDPNRLAALEEMVRCAVTGSLLLPDESAKSAVSGRVVDVELLVPSSWTGRLALAEEMVTCAVSGDLILSSEAIKSDFSQRLVSPKYAVKCAVTDKNAASDEVATCAFTHKTVHLENLRNSDISGSLYRVDEEAVSAVSGRKGHRSEFETCMLTGSLILPAEAGRSAISNKLIRLDMLRSSDKDVSRIAAEQEMVRCAVSGLWLMPDEVGMSAVSGLIVDKDLLIPSALSNLLALTDELFTCEESGSRVLPTETDTCDVTGKRVRRDLLGVSDISGKTVLKRILHLCPETGQKGTESELVWCDESGLLVAPSALGTCTVTGKVVVRRLLVDCAECHQPLLRTEAAVTSLGEPAHPHHTGVSQFTDRRYLCESLEHCQATGLLMEPQYVQDGVSRPIRELVESSRHGKPTTSPLNDQVADLLKRGGAPAPYNSVWANQTPNSRLAVVVLESRRFFRSPLISAFYLDLSSGKITGEVAEVAMSSGVASFKAFQKTQAPAPLAPTQRAKS